MNYSIHKTLIFFCLLLALFAPAKAEKIFKILYFQAPNTAPSELQVYVNGTHDGETTLPIHQFSKNYSIAAGGDVRISFFNKISEDPEVINLFPHITIPKDWSKFLVLAFDDPDNKVFPIKFRSVNASPGVFNNGDIKFINYTPNYFIGSMGDTKIKLKPYKNFTASKITTPNEDYQVKIDIVKPEKPTKRQWFIYQAWKYKTDVRTVAFIYKPQHSHYPTYYAVRVKGL